MSDYRCGKLTNTEAGEIADRAARRLMEYANPRAVTVDETGVAWIEPVKDAAEFDLVGVYSRDLGMLELTRRIAGDLLLTKQERGFVTLARRVVRRSA